ncbi:MAG: YmdB family metallophosphoesterase [Clostridia bacterium]|nr:YmdB family metallophosphoesterase [Clostridia bacterium]
MKLLCLGDVVSAVGVEAVEKTLPALKQKYRPDAILINGENSAVGNGIDRRAMEALFAMGADVITGGNHSFQRKGAEELHEETECLLRPANWCGDPFGRGECRLDMGRYTLRVISLQGSLFMNKCENPFTYLERMLKERSPRELIVVDFHAEATAEKQALARRFDGEIALLFGSHTHVQTNDAQILPKGTGYLTDIGMCGSQNSILGKGLAPCIHNFADPENRMKITDGEPPCIVNGLLAELDEQSKKCRTVELINLREID